MPDAPPALRYYSSLVGRWSGSLELRVTDRNALGAPLDQTTRIEGPCLRLYQQTAWSDGEVLLKRQP